MRVMVGLGNPGRRYAGTRHNAGWLAVDELARVCGTGRQHYGDDGVSLRCDDLLLFKPLLYMNRSGPPVARLLERTGVGLEETLVLMDDVDLPLGSIRLKPGGSSGGHRGLRSVLDALDSRQVPRLRMGIGPCPPGIPTREFVLGTFGPRERETADRMVAAAARAALCWRDEGIRAAMSRHNRTCEDLQNG